MKKLLYYSPFIPFIGLFTHFFWYLFRYEIYTIDEDVPKCFIPMFMQGIIYGMLFEYAI